MDTLDRNPLLHGNRRISLFLILLTTVLTPLAMLASWSIIDRAKEILHLHAPAGDRDDRRFCIADLFLFYVFWEVMLGSHVLLIGVWAESAEFTRP